MGSFRAYTLGLEVSAHFLQGKEVLVTVRGTAQIEDVVTDLNALPVVSFKDTKHLDPAANRRVLRLPARISSQVITCWSSVRLIPVQLTFKRKHVPVIHGIPALFSVADGNSNLETVEAGEHWPLGAWRNG